MAGDQPVPGKQETGELEEADDFHKKAGVSVDGVRIPWHVVMLVGTLLAYATSTYYVVNDLSKHETKFGHEAMDKRVAIHDEQILGLSAAINRITNEQIKMGKDTAVVMRELELLQRSLRPIVQGHDTGR